MAPVRAPKCKWSIKRDSNMNIETMAEYVGLALLTAAMLRGTVSAYAYVGSHVKARRDQRTKVMQFRERAGELFARVGPTNGLEQPTAVGKRQFRIVKREYENLKGDICSFYLTPTDGQPIPSYRPGQFLTFVLDVPGAARTVTRCYSLSQSPTDPQNYYRVSVKKMAPPPNAVQGTPAGVSSSFFHDQLAEGSVVEVLPPAGSFCLDHASTRPVVLVAGGVGLTPLIAMLNWLAATNSQREIWMFYGVRDRNEHAFGELIRMISERMPNFRVVVFYEQPTPACRKGLDYDVKGYVSVDVMKTLLRSQNYEFYVCGPPQMMTTVISDLKNWGVADVDIRSESFGGASAPVRSSATVLPKADAKPIQIKFARSKMTVSWTGRMGSLLELAEACGVDAKCACRAGQCGTCKIAIKRGAVDYVTTPQAPLEEGYCLPCVARPITDLVLDL